ncbi:hypothetical protein [Collimonas arenae]|uniref:hypothetical protein n=1 Tax=Collimonas arenae TaxID=279058 RepID=UPI000571C920|nr:hypothetical protein [Collimonas arenae]
MTIFGIHRNISGRMLVLGSLFFLFACGEGKQKGSLFATKQIVVDVVVFNYLNRPIYDVYLDGKMVGGSASLSDSPYGQFSTIAGVVVPLGPQTLTWILDGPKGMFRNGEIDSVKNSLVITPELVPPGVRSLGVHIYPDNTAELIFSKDVLEQSERGLVYAKEFQKHNE